MDLSRVNWSAAVVELHDEHRRTGTAKVRRALAAASSLRARFTDDFMVAAASTVAAIELEPLEPIHRVRDALARLRFGDLGGALDRLEALGEGVADLPFVLVVKALVTARRGEARTARNIADRALQIDPQHAGARFLHTEANLAAQAKGGLDKLGALPHGAGHDAAWADLLAKLAILRPADHRAVVQHLDRGVIAKGTRVDSLVRTISAWARATPDELLAAAEASPAGTRAEQLALALALGRLPEPTAAALALRALDRRAPDRPAVRRTLVAAVTRLAIAEAANARWPAALRAIQVCIEREPAEPVHHQNRAALFTLAGEHDAALDAWAELDRVHYVSALLGRLDPDSARRYAAPHRMFSQAGRLAGRTGIFVREVKGAAGEELAVHQELIDRDPEQLRHWLHHTRAALVFEVVSLGASGDRALLAPGTPGIALARAEGLCALVQSLAVLVPEEGRRLADGLAARFRAAATGAAMHYAARAPEADVLAVHRHAVELFAELALLCVRWEPDPARRAVFDEVLDTVRAVAPLFDERVLAGLVAERRDGPPDALRVLDSLMRVVLEVSDREVELDASQRGRLAGFLAANLRVSLVERRAVEARRELTRHEVEVLVEQLELARKDDPASARLEYWAAQLLMIGDFLDEAAAAVAAFHAIAAGDHPLATQIARIQELLDEKRQHGRAKQRTGGGGGGAVTAQGERDLAAREAELEHQPTSLSLYTELCHELALADRWRDAHAWAGRAIARCLTPGGQLRARELALELGGLEVLGKLDPGAMASFIAGARAAAVPALDRLDPAATPAGLEYVRGLGLLAADRRRDAQQAFGRALERCTRGIFLALLRPLAADVETAVLDAAKKEIDAALADGRFGDAFSRIAERMASVARPEPYLLELARTQLSALLPTIGTSEAPACPPPIRVDAAWAGELTEAIRKGEVPARIRALCGLAARVHEPSARDAATVTRKLDELAEQLVVAAALDASTRLAAAGDFPAALAALADLGPAAATSARVLRHRAIVQLRLEQLAEADAAVTALAALPDPLAREFAARYPGLKFRQQIAMASTLVRGKDFARARAVLDDAVPAAPDHPVELAYCRAYCAAAEGYRALTDGDRAAARRLLFEALAVVESRLADARAIRHDRLIELHAKLETDIGMVEGSHA
jgi:tetratricopeptide (TPR) repeat protein